MAELIDRIVEADRAIRPMVMETPLEPSPALSALTGAEVLLKLDHLQPTGSFKLRGATNKLRLVAAEGRHRRVVTASTGNHGRACAHAARAFGLTVTVYLCAATPAGKQQAIRDLGVEVMTVPGNALDAELAARHAAETQGIPYVAPYNDLDTVAGQGTLGLELSRQAPDLAAVFICTGGGGLIGGTGTALKARSRGTAVIGAWPEASTCMLDSLHAGEIVATPESPTLSDGSTGAVEPGSVTFPICQDVIDATVTVGEPAIARAMALIARHERWIVEGAAGVAVAAMLEAAERFRGRRIAAVLCGRNVALETFQAALGMAETA